MISLFWEFFKNISKFFKKLVSLLFLKSVPLILSFIISNGPGRESEEYIGTLQNAASIKTKPGSSQSEDNMKPLDFFKYGKIFSL